MRIACLTILLVASNLPPTRAGSLSGSVVLDWEPIATGLNRPVYMTGSNDPVHRRYIVEQAGVIRVVDQAGYLLATPFLNIGPTGVDRVGGPDNVFDERGLLGLAFDPDFYDSGYFYVHYTRKSDSASVIAEYHVEAFSPSVASTQERPLLVVEQPAANHNGGQLAFGPDGFLYIALGDGGFGGDPFGNGQNINTLLGSLLRISPRSTSPYGIPGDNPFAGGAPGRDEIFAHGFRNPWRFSFDRMDGRLFVADVGQESFEEVNLVEKGDNFGWNIMEGTHCFPQNQGCNMTGLTLPIDEFGRGEATALTGGYVYRGSKFPRLFGLYLCADYASGRIYALKETSPGDWEHFLVADTPFSISSFGEDDFGELYIVDHGVSAPGGLYRLLEVSADLNGDSLVDAHDLDEFLRQFSGNPASPGAKSADLDRNGRTDFEDLFRLNTQWRQSSNMER